MKTEKKLGLKIGAIFSIVSFLFTFTIAIPMFSVFPGEFVIQAFYDILNVPNGDMTYGTAGFAALFVFALLFIVALFFTLKIVRNLAKDKQNLKTSEIIVMMLVFYLIIHNLGYLILRAIDGFPIDALNVMGGIISFPFSSVLFVLIGLLIDWYWKKTEVIKI